MKQAELGVKGRAGKFRGRGASPEDAKALAEMVLNPESRCDVCGVPQRMLDLYHRKGWPVPVWRREQWGLQVDRISPGGPYSVENTRPLCSSCNRLRGAGRMSDKEILVKMRRAWQEALAPKHLWWLKAEVD